jgi:hypothetical protein
VARDLSGEIPAGRSDPQRLARAHGFGRAYCLAGLVEDHGIAFGQNGLGRGSFAQGLEQPANMAVEVGVPANDSAEAGDVEPPAGARHVEAKSPKRRVLGG